MTPIEESCPYDPRSRAARCRSCCDESNQLPPCVVAWLTVRSEARLTREPRRQSWRPDRKAA